MIPRKSSGGNATSLDNTPIMWVTGIIKLIEVECEGSIILLVHLKRLGMGKISCLVVVFIWLINLGIGLGFEVGKGCNGTLEDCFSSGTGGDMEFLGEEETGDLLRHYAAGARWLLQQSRGKVAQRSLMKRPVCPNPQYANCIAPGGGNGRCPHYSRCQRSTSGRS